jgi:hypothetical protein
MLAIFSAAGHKLHCHTVAFPMTQLGKSRLTE